MLRLGLSLLLIAALAGGPAEAAGKKPPAGTAQPEGADDDQDAPPGPPPGQPKGPPANFAQPQPQPRFVVLTEQQKRCGVQRRCVLDSRAPCPPCWQ